MTFTSTLASVAMAVGPPLVYIDQFRSILKRKDSTGFSHDACGVILVANILRIFFWFGKRFEVALLAQSIIMIVFQLALLYVCIAYKPVQPLAAEPVLGVGKQRRWYRPYGLWAWVSYGAYIEFIAGLIAVNSIVYLVLGKFALYVDIIGLLALSIDAVNAAARPSIAVELAQKVFGRFSYDSVDRMVIWGRLVPAFKTIYFFVQEGNSWQFKAFLYRGNTPEPNVAYISPQNQAELGNPDTSISRPHSVEIR